ncbi:MAG: Gfo/Idh/MocA family oxidoreductase [Vicinamibacteria bacterium]|nr:Gfo/Idh/MocA family oxidoreductase [Vicinamibacteria bacterium]
MLALPRVGIIGAGLMGRWHAQACRRAGGRVAAVVDLNLGAAQRLAAELGGAAAAGSLGSLSDGVTLDVVHVCTPPETHEEQIRAALPHGCPVIVEKPLAPTAAITEELIVAARRTGTWILPVHQTVFQDGVARALRWATDGPVRAFDYLACSAGASASPDRADEVVADILPHPLSLLDVLLPGALDAMQWVTHRTAPGELLVTAATGTTAVRFLISMHARPTRHELTLFGDEGTVTADLFHGFAWRERGHVSRMGKIARPFVAAASSSRAAAANLGRRAIGREPAYPGLNTLVKQVYAALDDPARRPFSDRHTLAVARARDQILHQLAHD